MYIDIKKILNQVKHSDLDLTYTGAEITPQNPVVKPEASTGIASTPDGFETSNPMNAPFLNFYGEQSERLVRNRQMTPPDPTVDASMLFDYFTDDQIPAPPVPSEVGGQSLETLSFPGDAIDKAGGAVEDATVTAGYASIDVGEAIGDAAKWVGGAVGDVVDEADSVLNSVTDGKFGEVTSDVGNFLEKRAWDVYGATEDVGIALGDAASWTAGAVGDAAGAAVDVLNDVTDGKFGEAVSDVGNGLVQTFQHVGSGDVGGAAGVAAGWTLEAAEDLAKAAAAAAEKAAKAAEEAAKAAAEAAAAAAEAAADAAEDVIDAVGGVIGDAVDAAGDVASDVGDAIGDLF